MIEQLSFIDDEYMTAVRKMSQKLGFEEVSSILMKHFKTNYTLPSGLKRYPTVDMDTKILVDGDQQLLHFRTMLKSVWPELVKLYGCLPSDFSAVDIDVVSMFIGHKWKTTFRHVLVQTWIFITTVCTSCLGRSKTCDMESLQRQMVSLRKECNTDAVCIRSRISNDTTWKLLGLLTLAFPMLVQSENVCSSTGVCATRSASGPGMVELNVDHGNVPDSLIKFSQSGIDNIDSTREGVEFINRLVKSTGRTERELTPLLNNAQVVLRSASSKIDVLNELEKRFSDLERSLGGTDDGVFRRKISEKINSIIDNESDLIMDVKLNPDGTYHVNQVFLTVGGEVLSIKYDVSSSESKAINKLWESMVDEGMKGELDTVSKTIRALGRSNLPPHVVFGRKFKENVSPDDITQNRRNVSPILLPASKHVSSTKILGQIKSIQESFKKTTSKAQILQDRSIDNITNQIAGSYVVSIRDFFEDGGNVKIVDGEYIASGKDEIITAKDTEFPDLISSYINDISGAVKRVNNDVANDILFIYAVNEDNPRLGDIAGDIAFADRIYGQTMDAISASIMSNDFSGFGPDVISAHAAVKELHAGTGDIVTKNNTDNALKKIVLSMYNHVQIQYVDAILTSIGKTRADLKIWKSDRELGLKLERFITDGGATLPLKAIALKTYMGIGGSNASPKSALMNILDIWLMGPVKIASASVESVGRAVGKPGVSVFGSADTSLSETIKFLMHSGFIDGINDSNIGPNEIHTAAGIVNEFAESGNIIENVATYGAFGLIGLFVLLYKYVGMRGTSPILYYTVAFIAMLSRRSGLTEFLNGDPETGKLSLKDRLIEKYELMMEDRKNR